MPKSDIDLAQQLVAKLIAVPNDECPSPRPSCSDASERGARAGSSAGNGRRGFLNACLALGLAGIEPAYCATPNQVISADRSQSARQYARLMHLRHAVADVGEAKTYLRLRTTFARHAINPWLQNWMEGLDDKLPRGFEAIVAIDRDDGELTIAALLDFSEWYEPEQEIAAAKDRLSVDQWLLEFRPTGRDDCLMALPLYYLYQHTGVVVPTVQATPDPWLDGLLHGTRGMLFWSHQWIELVRVIGNISLPAAHRMVRDYQWGRPDAAVALNQMRYRASGQSLAQIIEERSPTGSSFGSPDYVAGDWLHQYSFSEAILVISQNGIEQPQIATFRNTATFTQT